MHKHLASHKNLLLCWTTGTQTVRVLCRKSQPPVISACTQNYNAIAPLLSRWYLPEPSSPSPGSPSQQPRLNTVATWRKNSPIKLTMWFHVFSFRFVSFLISFRSFRFLQQPLYDIYITEPEGVVI